MKIKPFGKCGSCKFKIKCEIYTETNAKVTECVYQRNFKDLEKGIVGVGVSGKSQKRPKNS